MIGILLVLSFVWLIQTKQSFKYKKCRIIGNKKNKRRIKVNQKPYANQNLKRCSKRKKYRNKSKTSRMI